MDQSSFVVLVIDDHQDSRELYALALRRFGFGVRTAGDGREGLTMAHEAPPPSLIVLDLRLPDMHGRQTFEALRSDPLTHDIPVIAMSADPREMQQALVLGFAGFCPKPCPPDTLVRSIIGVLMPRVTARLADALEEPSRAVTVVAARGGPWWEVRVDGELAACWPSEFAARAAARQFSHGN